MAGPANSPPFSTQVGKEFESVEMLWSQFEGVMGSGAGGGVGSGDPAGGKEAAGGDETMGGVEGEGRS